MIVIAVLLVVIALFCALLYRNEQKLGFAKNIPEIFGMPFFGVTLSVFGMDSKLAYSAIRELIMPYDEKIMKLFVTPFVMFLAVKDPEYVKKVLNSPNALNKSFLYRFLEWKRSLLTSDADRWQPLRRYFNKAFTLTNLKTFTGFFDTNSRQLVKRLEEHVDGEQFDVMQAILLTSLSNICSTSVGLDLEGDELKTLIVRSYHRFHDYVIEQMLGFHHWFPVLSWLTPTYWRKHQLRRLINGKLYELVRKAEQLKKNRVVKEDEPRIFIDQVLSLNNGDGFKFTDEDLVNDTSLLISAGLATTTNLLCHCLLFLAMHPKIQSRVRQEILKQFPNEDEPVNYEGLNALSYTDMVIKETLRLAPSIGTLIRTTSGKVEIDEGLTIPTGYDIIISIIAMHRQKNIWGPDADSFNPNHFLPEEVEKRHPYSFIPFSAGPRNCIGYKYAMLAAKSMLVHLLRAYHFKTPYRMVDLEFETNIHVRLTTPYWVTVERYSQELDVHAN